MITKQSWQPTRQPCKHSENVQNLRYFFETYTPVGRLWHWRLAGEQLLYSHHSDGDNGAGTNPDGHHNWVIANTRTADALKAKGYHYRHLTAIDAGHCSGKVFDATLADTLVWAWRGFPTH